MVRKLVRKNNTIVIIMISTVTALIVALGMTWLFYSLTNEEMTSVVVWNVFLLCLLMVPAVTYVMIRQIRMLEEIAAVDYLTSTNSRRHFVELARRELERARRFHHPISLIIFDLDHFKNINDLYGHRVGDDVLRKVVRLAQASIRAIDIMGRYGGEEFVILLPETDVPGAVIVAERIRKLIASDGGQLPKQHISVTASFGISVSLPDKVDLLYLFDKADKALYTAKQNGRDRTEFFKEGEMEDAGFSTVAE